MFSRNKIVVYLKEEADFLKKAQEFKAMKDVEYMKFKYNQ